MFNPDYDRVPMVSVQMSHIIIFTFSAKCHKGLDSTNCNGHENEVYCTSCHRREFGPKGYGFAGGASGLSTESSIRKPRPVGKIQVHFIFH